SRLTRKSTHQSARDPTSSSPHVLHDTTSNNHNNSAGVPLCRNFQRGSCSFGERCKYVHTNASRFVTRNGNGNTNNRGSSPQWNNTTGRIVHGARMIFSPTRPTKMGYAPQPGNMPHISQATFGSRGVLGPAPGQAHVTQPTIPLSSTGPAIFSPSGPPTYTTGPLHGTWGPHVVYDPYVDQETTIPQAFNAMMVQDYGDSGWYMDTGETSHLAWTQFFCEGSLDPSPAPPM
ncbi:ribonuclease H-like domain-containing protein, partial [Tanacetum coccineum]